MLRQGITARQIMTKPAFENAIAVVMALGGSTNAVLHLLAIAREAEVDLTIGDYIHEAARRPFREDGRTRLEHPAAVAFFGVAAFFVVAAFLAFIVLAPAFEFRETPPSRHRPLLLLSLPRLALPSLHGSRGG